MKFTKISAILLCVCLLLTACGSSVATDMKMEAEIDRMESAGNGFLYDASPAETMSASGEELKSESPELTAVQTDRKLIKTVSIEAETEHYEELITTLDQKIAALGGYVESRQSGSYSRSRRWCRMTVRIPADRLPEFQVHVGESANVLSTSEQTLDVTLQYSDTEAKIASLEAERTRLMELLAQAGSLSDILEIQSRLSDVTYELERYESRRRGYDNQITYATVSLELREVQTLTPAEDPTVWQRITEGFADSLEGVGDDIVDFFVWLIVSLPYLAVWIPVTALILWLIRRIRRKVYKKRQSPPSEIP